ncbi:MAG: DUF2318 domain-containing protein [Chloroflexi bacterium]|nr:DUF2318 domain-containing protein [Chloroflexota bacterium]
MNLLIKNLSKTMKGTQQMSKIVVIGIILLGVILVAVACGGQESKNPVKATWIKAQVVGDSVSIPVAEVNNNTIVHFGVPVAAGSEMTFMGYNLDGKLNVRANVCPPCRSIGFSLSKETLVCDSCRTTFQAKTGDGISGACVAYPKAAVSYEISDGRVLMKRNDLVTAYQNTIEPGLP